LLLFAPLTAITAITARQVCLDGLDPYRQSRRPIECTFRPHLCAANYAETAEDSDCLAASQMRHLLPIHLQKGDDVYERIPGQECGQSPHQREQPSARGARRSGYPSHYVGSYANFFESIYEHFREVIEVRHNEGDFFERRSLSHNFRLHPRHRGVDLCLDAVVRFNIDASVAALASRTQGILLARLFE
jgi:hypothetical protein